MHGREASGRRGRPCGARRSLKGPLRGPNAAQALGLFGHAEHVIAAQLPDQLRMRLADMPLHPLVSKLRQVVPLEGRGDVRLALPGDAWIDLEAAAEGLHRAESAVAKGDFAGAWGPGRVAQHIASRGFLPGEDAPWADNQRRRLEEILVRSLELVGRACVSIGGGGELDTAERAARELIELAPYRESGHRLLMEALEARGNTAEALLVYERTRETLADTLAWELTRDPHRVRQAGLSDADERQLLAELLSA